MRHLAIDIGASSGRAIVGELHDGRLVLTEVYRFENGCRPHKGHLCWDMEYLEEQVICGLAAAREHNLVPETVGIDTWGVDYVLLDKNDQPIGPAYAYRDSRTDNALALLGSCGLSFDDVYARTGIQYQKFNTLFQLLADKSDPGGRLAEAYSLLMVPDYLQFCLTGKKVQEYTNASTTALVDAGAGTWDSELIAQLGLPEHLFGELSEPGTRLGQLSDAVAARVGYQAEVILPATHDTGSAWVAVPAKDEHAAYLSSGTWSLLGMDLKAPITTQASARENFTNEGGYGHHVRYLKNIMGLWMIQNVRREVAGLPSWQELVDAAQEAQMNGFRALIDPDDQAFLAPKSMCEAIQQACMESDQPIPRTTGELALCVYDSLAHAYARTICKLEGLTGVPITQIHIVGGGANNHYLNQRCAAVSGLPVYAGPTEATALGNIVVQALACDEFSDIDDARLCIHNSFDVQEVQP